MKKRKLIFYFSIFLVFCQVFLMFGEVNAISEAQRDVISTHCQSIKDDLKNIQRADSKTRIYLGGHYEAILNKFIIPLNIRLIENNLSTAELVENQNEYAKAKVAFANDFVTYQQSLEELVGVDCKNNPNEFYEKLKIVRQKRKTMRQDIDKMKVLISGHVKLVSGLESHL